jgi:regulatory protein
MTKKIESILKKKTGYEVIINDETFMIEPDLKLKYHLVPDMELDLKTFHELMDENEFSFFYRLCIVKLKKMQTRFELMSLMQAKGAKPNIIKQVLQKLESRKYIDDDEYTKIFIQLKSSSKGIKMLEYELKKKGVSHDVINKHLSVIDEQEAVSHLLRKKLTTLTSKSKQQKIQSLKSYLASKGFGLHVIEKNMNEITFDDEQEQSNLLKDYEKLSFKFQHLDLYLKNQEILKRLYQKGYSISDIKRIINQTLEL